MKALISVHGYMYMYMCILSRVKGYECTSLRTFGIITGMINAGLGLGSMIGPMLGGVLMESIGYGWLVTVISSAFIIMVRFVRHRC